MPARLPNRRGYDGTMDTPLDQLVVTVRSTRSGTQASVTFSQNPYSRPGCYSTLATYSSPSYFSDPVVLLAIAETVLKVAARRVIKGDQEV